MSNEDTLKAGIAAAKSGDLVQAAALFAEVVRVDPLSEQGWMYLGMSMPERERREYCLRRVLAINPNNTEAKSQLERLAGTAKTPTTQVPPTRTDIPKDRNIVPPASASSPFQSPYTRVENFQEPKPPIVDRIPSPTLSWPPIAAQERYPPLRQ